VKPIKKQHKMKNNQTELTPSTRDISVNFVTHEVNKKKTMNPKLITRRIEMDDEIASFQYEHYQTDTMFESSHPFTFFGMSLWYLSICDDFEQRDLVEKHEVLIRLLRSDFVVSGEETLKLENGEDIIVEVFEINDEVGKGKFLVKK